MPYVFDPNDVHIQQALSNFSVAYRNEAAIWRRVAPIVNVDNRSDKYRVFDKETEFQNIEDKTAPNANANEVAYKFAEDNFSVVDHALGAWIPVETIENADDPIRPELRAIRNIRNTLENNQEKRVADAIFTASAYAASNKVTLSGSSRWSDPSSSPLTALVEQIDAAIIRPNKLVLGADVWAKLRVHPDVVAAAYPMGGNAAQGGVIASTDMLASILELDEILVGRRRVNTANQGATPVYTRVWGKHALLCYVNDSPSIEDISLAYSFSETQSNPVRDFDSKKGVKGSVYVKDGWNTDTKVVAADVGFFFENAVA